MDIRQAALDALKKQRRYEAETEIAHIKRGRDKLAALLQIDVTAISIVDSCYVIAGIDLVFTSRYEYSSDRWYAHAPWDESREWPIRSLASLGTAIVEAETPVFVETKPSPRYGQIGVWEYMKEKRPYRVIGACGDQDGNGYLIVEYTDLDDISKG